MTDDATVERPFNQSQYWLQWVLANVAGWLIWGMLNFVLVAVISTLNVPGELGLFISLALLAIVGAILGGTQWWVLRQQVPQVSRWALFTALGFALATLFDLIFAGLGVGVMQWLVLRNVFNKTTWWPVLNAAAWPLGTIVGTLLGTLVGQLTNSLVLVIVITWGVAGAIIGALSGALLLWLLRENRALLESLRQEREAEQAKR